MRPMNCSTVAPRPEAASNAVKPPLTVTSVADLLAQRLPDPTIIVEDLLPEGLAILAGSPKAGKSWLSLSLCLNVAQGSVTLGEYSCHRGNSLYLGLEDSPRRLQSRILRLLGGSPVPYGCYCACEWSQFGTGKNGKPDGLMELTGWLDRFPNTRLVVIDTLAKVRSGNSAPTLYERDYRDLERLQRLSLDRNLAIVLVHHTNKRTSRNMINAVSGSTGLTGCADSIWILESSHDGECDATLWVSGRDIEQRTLALSFDKGTGRWLYIGEAEEISMSDERKGIRDLLSKAEEPLSPKQIASALGQSGGNIRRLLGKMLDDRSICRVGRGLYGIPERE
jgi:hypothetical protein